MRSAVGQAGPVARLRADVSSSTLWRRLSVPAGPRSGARGCWSGPRGASHSWSSVRPPVPCTRSTRPGSPVPSGASAMSSLPRPCGGIRSGTCRSDGGYRFAQEARPSTPCTRSSYAWLAVHRFARDIRTVAVIRRNVWWPCDRAPAHRFRVRGSTGFRNRQSDRVRTDGTVPVGDLHRVTFPVAVRRYVLRRASWTLVGCRSARGRRR